MYILFLPAVFYVVQYVSTATDLLLFVY